ncbi:OmpA family protein [Aliiroseovarius sp. PTFE2010]|uniref:OmpA family protein n=1 Tax=Aliiroseovarius sp. PTFE2010 TaxID=3417190 RepID=UPI003CFA9340
MRLSTILPYVATVLLAGAASIAVAILSVGAIERSTLRALDLALNEQGYGWAQVTVDGLQVHVYGTAPDEASRFIALSTAGRIVDGARILDKMTVDDPKGLTPPAFNIEILRNDDGVSLFGLIPAATDHAMLTKRATKAAGDVQVTDLLEIADFPAPATWNKALTFGFDALELLPQSKISITPEHVDITALSQSAEQKRTFANMLARRKPGNVDATIDISAPRPVLTPFTLRFVNTDETTQFDACSASSQKAADTILAAARAVGLADGSCTIGLGAPSPDWPKAATLTIAATEALGGGSVTMSDTDITLVATPETDQETFDTVVGKLKNDLPRVFALHAVLPEPVVVDGTDNDDGPPEFIVTRSPEGQVQLRGRVQDDRTRVATESFARAQFGVDGVYGAMRLDEDLPLGWSARVLASVEALAHLHNGSVITQPDFVQVRGVADSESAKADIARILAAKLGDAANFDIDVQYDAALDPKLNIPTPQECVAAINEILATDKIVFAPGETDVPPSARATLDAIADQIRSCEGVAMEIGGHTDSQGREEMNLNLSQARANAVLNGLLARRVLTSSLTSKGYGETVPIGDNQTEAGREANRRIEFTLIETDDTPDQTPAEPTETTETTSEDTDE